ncbi:MAG TPA: hypothetical protein VN369_06225 [Terriglobales bacterium]|nr:hypothetical protein [Terriglobales bacterium]
MNNYEATLRAFEEFLVTKSNHNTVAKMQDCSSSTGFLCEVLTSNESYFLKIRVDKNIEFAIVEAFPGITALPPYRAMTAQYCQGKTDEKKVAYLCASSDNGRLFCHIEASFKEAPLTGETLEDMEQIVISFLHDYREELEYVTHGLLFPKGEDDRERRLKDLLSGLEDGKDGAAKEDDDFDGDPSGRAGFPFGGLAKFLAGCAGDEDDCDKAGS